MKLDRAELLIVEFVRGGLSMRRDNVELLVFEFLVVLAVLAMCWALGMALREIVSQVLVWAPLGATAADPGRVPAWTAWLWIVPLLIGCG